MSESIEQKQFYLRAEIIEKGYPPEEFTNFMANLKGEVSLDLENWSFNELQQVVNQFKIQYQKQSKAEFCQQQNELQTQALVKEKEQDQNNYSSQLGNIDDSGQNNTIPNAEQKKNNTSSELSFPNHPFEEYESIIKTKKLDNNEITEQNNLYVTIKDPVKINPGLFSSSYYQYTVEIHPANFKVVRKVSDFTFLYEILPIFNGAVFNPVLPNFEFGLKDDSSKKMLYIQNYVNSLIENKFFRSLPIVYEFLTVPQEEWNKLRQNNYSKIKPPSLIDMPTLEGEIHIKINNLLDDKGVKIKDEINKKSEAFDELNTAMDELLDTIEKLSLCYSSLAKSLLYLTNTHKSNNTMFEFFNRLLSLTKIWSKSCIKQKDFFRDEFKYFFKFMNKENISYLKKYEEYKTSRDEYISKFEKVKKIQVRQKKDFDAVFKLRRNYGLQLIMINKEYESLGERQAYRCMTQFAKFNQNRDIILQNFNNCIKLFNINEDINNNVESNTQNQEPAPEEIQNQEPAEEEMQNQE